MAEDPARMDTREEKFNGTQLELSALQARALLIRKWFGGTFRGEAGYYMPLLLLGLYLEYRKGLLPSRKGAGALIGAEHAQTTRKYVEMAERLHLIEKVASKRDRRKELIRPTAAMLKMVEDELSSLANEMVAMVEQLIVHGPVANLQKVGGPSGYVEIGATFLRQMYQNTLGQREGEPHRDVLELNQLQDNIADYSETIAHAPENVDAYLQRGWHYYLSWCLSNDEDEKELVLERAIADLTRAIELKPRYQNAYVRRAEVLRRRGMIHKGVLDLTEAIRLNPRDPDFYRLRAEALTQLGQLTKARADKRMAKKLGPPSKLTPYY